MNPDSRREEPLQAAAEPAPEPAAEAPRPRLRERFRSSARGEVLDAAEAVFAQAGLQDARVEDIAAAAGVSVGTVYNLFQDREGLVIAVLERRREAMRERVTTWIAESVDLPFEARFRGFIQMLFLHMWANWPFMRLINQLCATTGRGGPVGPRLSTQTILEIHSMLTSLVRRGVEVGDLRPLDPHVGASALMGMIRNTVEIDLLTGQDPPSEARADELVRLFLDGARAGGHGP